LKLAARRFVAAFCSSREVAAFTLDAMGISSEV
jgi:hypothetical protein